jgi:hypothetical protein
LICWIFFERSGRKGAAGGRLYIDLLDFFERSGRKGAAGGRLYIDLLEFFLREAAGKERQERSGRRQKRQERSGRRQELFQDSIIQDSNSYEESGSFTSSPRFRAYLKCQKNENATTIFLLRFFGSHRFLLCRDALYSAFTNLLLMKKETAKVRILIRFTALRSRKWLII